MKRTGEIVRIFGRVFLHELGCSGLGNLPEVIEKRIARGNVCVRSIYINIYCIIILGAFFLYIVKPRK